MTEILNLPLLSFAVLTGTNEDWTDAWAYLDAPGNPISGAGITLNMMLRSTADDEETKVVTSSVSGLLDGLPLNGSLSWDGMGLNVITLAIPESTMERPPPAPTSARCRHSPRATPRRSPRWLSRSSRASCDGSFGSITVLRPPAQTRPAFGLVAGPAAQSAYQAAVAQGFVGTLTHWRLAGRRDRQHGAAGSRRTCRRDRRSRPCWSRDTAGHDRRGGPAGRDRSDWARWRRLFAYIKGYYNRQRIHSALGYITPEQTGRNAR